MLEALLLPVRACVLLCLTLVCFCYCCSCVRVPAQLCRFGRRGKHPSPSTLLFAHAVVGSWVSRVVLVAVSADAVVLVCVTQGFLDERSEENPVVKVTFLTAGDLAVRARSARCACCGRLIGDQGDAGARHRGPERGMRVSCYNSGLISAC